ncbi:MAG: ATP-binding protein [Patescibacteria group bacterium]
MTSPLEMLIGDIGQYLPPGWQIPKERRMSLHAQYYSAVASPELTQNVEVELCKFLEHVPLSASRKNDAGIAITDLVENTIVYGDKTIERYVATVFLHIPRYVFLVGVADNLPLIPDDVLVADPTTSEALAALPVHGRGLYIVRMLFDIFSQVQALDGKGKIVWFGIDMRKELTHAA